MGKNDEKLKDLLAQVEQGTRAVFESDRYRNYLATISKFHTYSFRNNLLILMQKPEANYVAGYTAWQNKFKRQVQRGEKGIQIVGYTPKKVNVEQEKKDSSGKTIIGADGQPVKETVTRQIPCFAPVYVYDVSQTEGEPLPKLVNELNGDVEAYQDLMQAIREVSPYPISFENINGGARGYCDPLGQKIVIQQGMSEAQSVKTAIHEVTHADLHAPETTLSMKDRTDRHTREVEAESTAFVVCSHYGIDTSDYTFPYLATWSSTKELNELKSSLDTIQKQAAELIDRIDTRFQELLKEHPTHANEHEPKLNKNEIGVESKMNEKTNNPTYYAISNDRYLSYPHLNSVVSYEESENRPIEMFTIINNYPSIDKASNNDERENIVKAAFEKQGLMENVDFKFIPIEQMQNMINELTRNREKTRDQLGFRDTSKAEQPQPQKRMSMKDRFAAVQAEADRRAAGRSEIGHQQKQDKERGAI